MLNKCFARIQFILVSFCILLFSCERKESSEVVCFGALKNAMKKNDLSGYVSIDTLDLTNFFALGAIEGLNGELLILDGEVFISTQKDTLRDQIEIHNSTEVVANFLVGAKVTDWKSYSIPKGVKTKVDLEKFIAITRSENGIDTTVAFPFLLEGKASSISWHVVNWDEKDTIHTHEKHVKSGAYSSAQSEKVKILGFYSENHHGIFTHHSSNMHMHVLNASKSIVGHLDDLVLGDQMVLKFPN